MAMLYKQEMLLSLEPLLSIVDLIVFEQQQLDVELFDEHLHKLERLKCPKR